MPITVERLSALVAGFRDTGDIDAGFADQLEALLAQASAQLAAQAVADACETLKNVVAAVESGKGQDISVPAGEHLEREGKALRARLGCG